MSRARNTVYYFWESSFKRGEELGVNFLFFYTILLNYIEIGLYRWIPPANILEHEVILKSEALGDRSKEPGSPCLQPCGFCHTSSKEGKWTDVSKCLLLHTCKPRTQWSWRFLGLPRFQQILFIFTQQPQRCHLVASDCNMSLGNVKTWGKCLS